MPKYETKKDRANQARAMEAFAKIYRYEFVDLPQYHEMDFAIVERQRVDRHTFPLIKALVEVKCRTFSINKYPTMMVDIRKANYALNCGLPTILLTSWTDALAFIKFKSERFYTMGGRRDRDDPYDYDIMCHYKIKDFTRLK